MLDEVLDRLFGPKKPRLPLNTEPLPIDDLAMPKMLRFALVTGDGRPAQALCKEGDEVKAGDFLGDDGSRPVVSSPVSGKVVGVTSGPSLRGERGVNVVLIEPAADTTAKAFSPLDPDKEAPANCWDRIKAAGILTNSMYPRPLGEVIGPESGMKLDALVILAADREPEVCSALQLLRDRALDVGPAVELLSRLTGAGKVYFAGVEDAHTAITRAAGGSAKVLTVKASYPESLPSLVAEKAGGGNVRVIGVETALAALEAVRDGKVQDSKVLTFIGPDGRAKKNLRVALGTRLLDVFASRGLKPRDMDKVIVGGPMQGFAQFSLDAAVDQGVDAVMLIPHESQIEWSDEPCVSCGACIKECPTRLQPSLLGSYAEFGLFDRTEELGIDYCIECGLCAFVCPARRPLVQYLRLAKKMVKEKRAALEVAETEACDTPPPAEEAAAENAGQ